MRVPSHVAGVVLWSGSLASRRLHHDLGPELAKQVIAFVEANP